MFNKRALRRLAPDWLINFYHLSRGVLACYYYGNPSKSLRVIGVTGTNGKTTTCHLITSVLEADGRKVGMATTVSFKIGRELTENNLKMTTASPFLIQKLLRDMVKAGIKDVVLEVTSIGLVQHRLWGINFQTAVFTNLTHDHLDYHGSMERYRRAKEQLFSRRPTLSVINVDDPAAEHFIRHTANKTLTYSVKNRADLMAKKIYARPGGTDFVLLAGSRQATINLPLPGTFNVYNALAAAAVGLGLEVPLERVVDGLRQVQPVPGRMEVIEAGQAFTAIVDYAHTPDAMLKVYETVKPTVRGKLIVVFGATGRRDKAKRPILGALAGKFADYVVLTTDDPYDEDPHAIIDEVAEGVPRGRPRRGGRPRINRESEIPIKYKDSGEDIWWWRLPDRREAIAKACELARPQDVILVLGKGAEKVMVVGDPKSSTGYKFIPWSDRQVLEELLVKYQIG
ncbi:MAG: UDP-N-acetylmuramoyl-L-alanyl-D-glutamate--2,6-diaminopimelate ligase [Candidatus Berkelbacteria bacterium]|nr:MAG: UDP-N-acetylmuramoyl-L-alanyl-D-glutamate--2,6-diaminopimelate ligase [Candidatus Berkelbacteria bacterium]QQG51735.1 MAG: UDP-N-acetylmuramoyl-L-alanyl-D-glutamate--2,6-diaminopimelate ligase [Candidatus Berkelbacteria bacterium]